MLRLRPHSGSGHVLAYGRAPWGVLWASKVAQAGHFQGSAFRPGGPSRATETHCFRFAFFALLLCLLLYRLTPPSKYLYFETATVQEQPRFKLFSLWQQ